MFEILGPKRTYYFDNIVTPSAYIFEIHLKMASKLTKNGPKMVENYKNYTGIFENWQPLPKIRVHFWHFRHFPVYLRRIHLKYTSKWLQNWLKMAQKWLKITKIIPEFSTLTEKTDFQLLTVCRKCTEIFVFWLSVFPVHFHGKTRNPETVTETHGLSTKSSLII